MPDPTVIALHETVSEITSILSVHDLPGLWLATGTRLKLSIELSAASALELTRVANGGVCNSVVEVDATIRSSDGALDAQVRARVSPYGALVAPLPALDPLYSGRAAWPPDEQRAWTWLNSTQFFRHPPETSPTLFVEYDLETSPLDVTAFVYDGRKVVGAWASDGRTQLAGPPYPYTPDPLLASACAGADEFQDPSSFTPYPSAEAAVASMTGTWVRCIDPVPSSHAGLQILPDGTWRDFTVEAGELIARSGFQHEGFLDVFDASNVSSTSGVYQIDLMPFGRRSDGSFGSGSDSVTRAWEPALVFDSGVEEWPSAVYRRTTLPVRVATVEAADAERAGAPACAHSEQDMVRTREESAALLTGDFVLCSGWQNAGIARLRFAPSSVELHGEDGSVIRQLPYHISTMNPGLTLGLTKEDGNVDTWFVTVSRRPLKLWIDTDSGPAVFSAVP